MVFRLAGCSMDGRLHREQCCSIGHQIAGQQVFAAVDPVGHNTPELPSQRGAVKLLTLLAFGVSDSVGTGGVGRFNKPQSFFFGVHDEKNVLGVTQSGQCFSMNPDA